MYSNFKELNFAIRDLINTVASMNIETGAEGSVIYLCEVNNNQDLKVLNLSKIKTLEY